MPTLSGTVLDISAAPVSRVVRVFRKDSGLFVGEVISNASTGAWSITTQDTREHFAIVHDGTPNADWQKSAIAIPLNGADNSTTFIDLFGNKVTPSGAVKISTARSRWGGSSALFAGSGDYLYFNQGDLFDVASGDFFMSVQVYVNAYNGNTSRVFQSANGDVVCGLYVNIGASGQLSFAVSSNGSGFDVVGGASVATVPTGAWKEIAFGRSGNNFYGFFEGTKYDLATSSAAVYYSASHVPVIGGQSGINRSLNGNMQAFHFIKGRCPFVADYTPRTSEYFYAMTVGSENALIYDSLTPA